MSNSEYRIKVCVRCRPVLPNEAQKGLTNTKVDSSQTKSVNVSTKNGNKQFSFDQVFSTQHTNYDIYQLGQIDYFVDKTLQGYNATIFAYGQTGSGKTFTLEGPKAKHSSLLQQQYKGVVHLGMESLFSKIEKFTSRTFSIYCSFLQIYNEKIYDLLNPLQFQNEELSKKQKNQVINQYQEITNGSPEQILQNQGLKMRWNKQQQFYVENLYLFECKNLQEIMQLYSTGVQSRITSSHVLNLNSSRSHSIFQIRIESQNLDLENTLTSTLEFVDLAGSERISVTGSQGAQAKESIDINKSLFFLRQVIVQLSDQQAHQKELIHIPFRESKLTSLLKKSLGGNSFALMIACISPIDHYIDETLSTLEYAAKAQVITNMPIQNDDPKIRQVHGLQQELSMLTDELNKAKAHIEFLEQIKNIQKEKMITEDPSQQNFQKQDIDQYFNNNESPDINNFNKLKEDIHNNKCVSYEDFSTKLIQTILMIRQLLEANKNMHSKVDKVKLVQDSLEKEVFLIKRENLIIQNKLNNKNSPSKYNTNNNFYVNSPENTKTFYQSDKKPNEYSTLNQDQLVRGNRKYQSPLTMRTNSPKPELKKLKIKYGHNYILNKSYLKTEC